MNREPKIKKREPLQACILGFFKRQVLYVLTLLAAAPAALTAEAPYSAYIVLTQTSTSPDYTIDPTDLALELCGEISATFGV